MSFLREGFLNFVKPPVRWRRLLSQVISRRLLKHCLKTEGTFLSFSETMDCRKTLSHSHEEKRVARRSALGLWNIKCLWTTYELWFVYMNLLCFAAKKFETVTQRTFVSFWSTKTLMLHPMNSSLDVEACLAAQKHSVSHSQHGVVWRTSKYDELLSVAGCLQIFLDKFLSSVKDEPSVYSLHLEPLHFTAQATVKDVFDESTVLAYLAAAFVWAIRTFRTDVKPREKSFQVWTGFLDWPKSIEQCLPALKELAILENFHRIQDVSVFHEHLDLLLYIVVILKAGDLLGMKRAVQIPFPCHFCKVRENEPHSSFRDKKKNYQRYKNDNSCNEICLASRREPGDKYCEVSNFVFATFRKFPCLGWNLCTQ